MIYNDFNALLLGYHYSKPEIFLMQNKVLVRRIKIFEQLHLGFDS